MMCTAIVSLALNGGANVMSLSVPFVYQMMARELIFGTAAALLCFVINVLLLLRSNHE